jgi:hypothetical protein
MKYLTYLITCTALLLSLPSTRAEPPPQAPHPPGAAVQDYIDFAKRACARVKGDIPKITHIAEICAQRHIRGGHLRLTWNSQGFVDEIWGRSGGLVHLGDGREFKSDRTPQERSQDIVFVGWQRAPTMNKLDELRERKAYGAYLIGFGPWAMPELTEYVDLCDVWFDTGFGSDDRVVAIPDGTRAGHGNMLFDMLHGWTFFGEFVAALTREGKMPPMWQAYLYEEGVAWGNRYLKKTQFHDDFEIPPIPPGELARRYLDHMEGLFDKLAREQMVNINKAADLIVAEHKQGRKTVCASMGHTPYTYVCAYEGQKWGVNANLHSFKQNQVEAYSTDTADGALVLRVGYFGTNAKTLGILEDKQQRVMFISAGTERDGEVNEGGVTIKAVPDDALVYIDMGMQFGDATLELKGYPIRILPPSGIMQLVTYECVNVEVLTRLAIAAN